MMKLKVNIPTSQEDIKLKDFQTFMQGYMPDNDEHNKLLAFKVFLGIDYDVYNTLRVSDIEDTWDILSRALNTEVPLKTTFTHDEVPYGFIPDLSSISLGEYVDAEKYFIEPKDYHKFLGVLYRRVTKITNGLYDIEPYKGYSSKRAEMFKELPMSYYTGVSVFFYRISKDLLKDTLRSLRAEMSMSIH